MQLGGIPPATRPGGGATKQVRREEEVAGANRSYAAAQKPGREEASVGKGLTYAAVVKQGPPSKVDGQPEHLSGGPSVTAPTRNPLPFKRMDLTFIEPQLVEGRPMVDIPYSVTAVGEERWRHTLIGYVLGLNPSFSDMEGFVRGRWAELGVVRVHMMGRGLFVFQMETEEAKQAAMEMGPWSFSRRPLILRPWSVGMALDKPEVGCIPVWVQYPHLPIDLWTPEALSRITSQLGKPLFADRNTSEQRRLGFARVCVEIKVDTLLFEELPVRYANGFVHYQQVVYEWMPSKCLKCGVFGHTDQGCKAVRTQVYVPKKSAGENILKGVSTDETVLGQGLSDVGTRGNKGKSVVIEKEVPTTSGVAGQGDGDQKPSSSAVYPMLTELDDGWRVGRTIGQVKSKSVVSLTPVSRGNRFSLLSPDAVVNRTGKLSSDSCGKLADLTEVGVVSRGVDKVRVMPGLGSELNNNTVLDRSVPVVSASLTGAVGKGVENVGTVLSDVLKQTDGLSTPVSTPMVIRQDTPRHAVEGQNSGTLLLDPVVEEDGDEESDEDEESDWDEESEGEMVQGLEADLLRKVSLVIAQLASNVVEEQGSGSRRRKKAEGQQ